MTDPHDKAPEQALPPGWSRPKPDEMTDPTWWPAFLAFGATLAVWGLFASFIILIIGLVTFAVSLAGWIGDIRHEHRKD